jgi:hypothetical protein
MSIFLDSDRAIVSQNEPARIAVRFVSFSLAPRSLVLAHAMIERNRGVVVHHAPHYRAGDDCGACLQDGGED